MWYLYIGCTTFTPCVSHLWFCMLCMSECVCVCVCAHECVVFRVRGKSQENICTSIYSDEVAESRPFWWTPLCLISLYRNFVSTFTSRSVHLSIIWDIISKTVKFTLFRFSFCFVLFLKCFRKLYLLLRDSCLLEGVVLLSGIRSL